MSGSDLVRRRPRPLLTLVGLLVALFVLDRTAGAVLGLLVSVSDFRISRAYAGKAKADVLILGNSVANAMVIPPDMAFQLGRSVFSLAMHGLDARTQEAMVKDMIDRGEAPKLAIMEIRPVMAPMVEAPEFAAYQGDSRRLGPLIRESDGVVVPWGEVFHINRFNSRAFANTLQKIVDRDDQRSGSSNGHINSVIKERWLETPQRLTVKPDQMDAFRETVLALRKAGSRVVVVATPLDDVTWKLGAWAPKLIADVRAQMPTDVPVVDYTRLFNEDPYFEDPIHLNKLGRQKFLPYMVDLARKNGV